jgi:myosin heavy subunit
MVSSSDLGSKNCTSLRILSPESLLDNISLRYHQAFDRETQKHQDCGIYTWVGTVLVAVNPFKRFNIYDDSQIQNHFRKSIAHADPHPFGVASHAFCTMHKHHMPQSIIISGESGAGKLIPSIISLFH